MSEPTEQEINYWERITVDPDILVGKPVITGTRIPRSLILNLLAHGHMVERIIETYPILTAEDIVAAIAYANAASDRWLGCARATRHSCRIAPTPWGAGPRPSR